MERGTRRFRKFAANLARQVSADMLNTFKQIGISKYHRVGRDGRYWVTGYLWGHAFEALLIPQHAKRPETELAESRISKLWVWELTAKRLVAAFENTWNIQPTTEKAREIVDYLTTFLAFRAYGPLPRVCPVTEQSGLAHDQTGK